MSQINSSLTARIEQRKRLDMTCIDDVRQKLNRFRHDRDYRGGAAKRVPLMQFARLCGLSRQTLYDIISGESKGITPATRDAILAAIKLVDAGVRWKRVVIRRAVIERIVHVPKIVEWRAVMPDGSPAPPVPKKQRTPRQEKRWLSEHTPA